MIPWNMRNGLTKVVLLWHIPIAHPPFLLHIAKEIKNLSNATCKKLLVLMGGGYNSSSSVISYYNIMCGLLNIADYIKEKEILDYRTDEVESLIFELKKLLGTHWTL